MILVWVWVAGVFLVLAREGWFDRGDAVLRNPWSWFKAAWWFLYVLVFIPVILGALASDLWVQRKRAKRG